MTDHPTPPPELRQQWRMEAPPYRNGYLSREDWFIARAVQWGADHELEACCDYLRSEIGPLEAARFRAARRPKPPSLKELAMQMLSTIEHDAHYLSEITDTIRRALEALPDD